MIPKEPKNSISELSSFIPRWYFLDLQENMMSMFYGPWNCTPQIFGTLVELPPCSGVATLYWPSTISWLTQWWTTHLGIVYSNQLWWFGGWFIVIVTTLVFLGRLCSVRWPSSMFVAFRCRSRRWTYLRSFMFHQLSPTVTKNPQEPLAMDLASIAPPRIHELIAMFEDAVFRGKFPP